MRRIVIVVATVAAILGLAPLAPKQWTSNQLAQAASTSTPSGSFGALGDSGEIPSMRTRTSDTYLQNGHLVAHIFSDSINYQDNQGQWQPIDDSIVSSSASGYAEQNKSNRYTVSFPADLGAAPVTVKTDAGWVAFQLVGASGPGAVSGDTDTFALPGGSIAWTSEPDSLKESITLNSASSPSTYVFSLQMSPDLTAQQDGTGGIDILNAAHHTVYSLDPPTVKDQAGATSSVSMTLADPPGGQTITLAADPTWLADPNRQYPVIIDPTTTLGATQASYVYAQSPTTNYCSQASYTLDVQNSASATYRSLLQFDLSALPPQATISSASLTLIKQASTYGGTLTVDPLIQPWTTATTWNTRDGTSAWTTAGGTYSTIGEASVSLGNGTGPISTTETGLVQDWADGTLANDGVLLQISGSTGLNQFAGPWHGATGPSLYVSYSAPTLQLGQQGFYTSVGQQIDDASSFSVNVVDGNLLLQRSDITMPGIGPPLTVIDSYNSLRAAYSMTSAPIMEGFNWSTNIGNGVGLTASGSSMIYTGPSGYQVVFNPNGSGGYTSPPGTDATLVQNGGGTYTLTDNASGVKENFTSGGYLTSVVDPAGNTISYGYTYDQVSSITDTQGRTTTFTYAGGLLTAITDPAGKTYQYGYTGAFNPVGYDLTSYTDPNGKTTNYAYSSHLLTQITDPNGNETTITYDSSSRVSSIVNVTNTSNGTGPTTTFGYNPSSCMSSLPAGSVGCTTVTDANNHTTTYDYDGSGRVTSVTDALGHTSSTTWTSDNQPATVQEPSGGTTNLSYDSLNNLTKVTLPTGATASCAYTDSNHPYLPTSCTDPSGNNTTVQYTPAGMPSIITNQDGKTESISYNTNGTPSSVTDWNGHTTTLSYYCVTSGAPCSSTDTGLPYQETPPCPDGSSPPCAPSPTPIGPTTYAYNSSNQPNTVTDGAGNQTTLSYDPDGRVLGAAYTGGSSVGYSYDADGNEGAMSDASGTASYIYDALNNLTQETLPSTQTISYTYDNVGNELTQTDNCGTQSYTYTADDQTATVKDQTGATTTLSYGQNGNETAIAYPDGVTEQKSYDSAGELTKIWSTNSSDTTLTSYSYSYTNPATDQPDVIPYSETDVSNDVTQYTYDALSRLTSAVTTNNGQQTASDKYGYDANGNLTSTNVDGTTTVRTVNADNELTQAGSTTYSYSATGDLTSGSDGSAYSYNTAEQTTSIQPAGSNPVSISYSGAGETQLATAGSTNYTYGQGGLSTVTDGSGTTCMTTTPDGQTLSQTTSSGKYDYLQDGHGSTTGLADSSGTLAYQASYDPTCVTGHSSGSVQPHRGCDQQIVIGNTGFYQTGSGVYDPYAGLTSQEIAVAQSLMMSSGSSDCSGDPVSPLAQAVLAGCDSPGQGLFLPMMKKGKTKKGKAEGCGVSWTPQPWGYRLFLSSCFVGKLEGGPGRVLTTVGAFDAVCGGCLGPVGVAAALLGGSIAEIAFFNWLCDDKGVYVDLYTASGVPFVTPQPVCNPLPFG